MYYFDLYVSLWSVLFGIELELGWYHNIYTITYDTGVVFDIQYLILALQV